MNYRDRPGPLVIAHRGGAGLAAENTLEAFGRSYSLGVRYLETDVRLSADGQLVVFHDASLNRVTAARGSVGSRALRELIQLPVLGGGTIPSLASVLASFPRACFTLDVKEPGVVGPLAELLQTHGLSGRVCVAAARGQWLQELRVRLGPDLCTALSWRNLAHLAARPRGRYGAAGFAHIPLRLGRVPVFREELVRRAHASGVRAIVWTVNDPITMHRLLDSGVDGIITDRPDLLRDVMISRGQWHAPDNVEARPPLPDLVC